MEYDYVNSCEDGLDPKDVLLDVLAKYTHRVVKNEKFGLLEDSHFRPNYMYVYPVDNPVTPPGTNFLFHSRTRSSRTPHVPFTDEEKKQARAKASQGGSSQKRKSSSGNNKDHNYTMKRL